MDISSTRNQAIDYAPCRYGGSRLWFRGPRRSLRSSYVACLGGCGVYGRYVARPWTQLLDAQVGCTVINLGVENAGIDAYLNDPGALATAANARVVVIELTGTHNTSNRFYSTHPRRNDRFLKASEALMSLYPEMDFTEVHFTRHLLGRLHAICPERYNMVVGEAQSAWQARLRSLIAQMNGDVVLLWFAPKPLPDAADRNGAEGLFLSRAIVDGFVPHVRGLVEVIPQTWRASDEFLDVPVLEMSRGAHLPGPAAHAEAAVEVARSIVPMLQ